MKRRHLLALLPALHPLAAAFAADGATGIVLLHGKQSRPADVADIAARLRNAGCKVATPEMAWSQRREFDVPYPAALEEVAAACKEVQAGGATRDTSEGCRASRMLKATKKATKADTTSQKEPVNQGSAPSTTARPSTAHSSAGLWALRVSV